MRLPTASYNQPSRNASRLVNCFAVASTGKGPVEVIGTPGVVTYRALEGPGRGLAVQEGKLYALAGSTLYRVSDGSEMGSIPGNATVTFAPGVNELVTDNGYVFDGTSVSAITDPEFPQLAAVDFVDGFVVGVEKNTGRFISSALNDGTSYDGLDFATAEGAPDNLVTLKVDHREVILFGTDTVELWYNAGTDGFPFQRTSGGFVELGCLARLGVVKADNSVFWLASDRTIRRLSGRTPVKVSQSGVEEALSRYSTLADCEGYTYTWDGLVHVAFRFPSEGATWVYVVNTGEWYESTSEWVSTLHHDGRVWVQHLDGSVGYLSDVADTQFGESVTREVVFPNIYSGNTRNFHSSLEVILRTGDCDIGLEPKVQLDISDDGGNTYVSLPSKDMGQIGQYRKVIRWFRLGTARDRVYRLRVSDPVPFHLVGAELEVVGGAK